MPPKKRRRAHLALALEELIEDRDQEQRTAPRWSQVGVVPEVRVSGRGHAVIYTRGWVQVSSARIGTVS